MVDKKACKIRKRKYKINGAVLVTRLTMLLVVFVIGFTVYGKITKNSIVESSAYITEEGISSMASGVQNGGVYTSAVAPKISSNVEKATLTRDGQKVKFRSGKKISKGGSYILILEDKSGNVDTIYFDIEN